jgi:TIR domain
VTPVVQADSADPPRPPGPGHVFLSHCTQDKDRFVEPFARRLRDRGVRVWVDHGEIRPGDSLVQRIFGDGIGRADAVIVVLSRHSAASRWVRAEIDAACMRRILDGIRVVAVCLDHVPVPPALGSLLYVEVDPAADWSADLDRIMWALG